MSNRTVLLIDYDPGSIDSATRPLEDAGFNVEVAHDGLSGLEAFEKLRPDLLQKSFLCTLYNLCGPAFPIAFG